MKRIKFFCLLLTVATFFCSAVMFSQSGETGPLTWEIENGTLTISGEGEMPDYGFTVGYAPSSSAPWYPYHASITNVLIGSGVTRIGEAAFLGCTSLVSVDMPSVTTIGWSVFMRCPLKPTEIILLSGLISELYS